MPYKSKEVLNALAKIASDGYLKSKASLNASLKKIASSEGLEPHQVNYVAAEANKAVWANHYKTDKAAAYDFPIADPTVILGDLQNKPVTKTASMASLDYSLPPNSLEKVAHDRSYMGVFESGVLDDVSRKEIKAQLSYRMEKIAMEKDRLRGEALLIKNEIHKLEESFIKEARQTVIGTPFSERPSALEKLAEFVRGTGEFEIGRELMKKLASKIVREGLIKQADMKAPEQYISEKLPARIINGNHPLFITIKTIRDKQKYLSDCNNGFIICDDTLPLLKEKIREL